MGLYQTVPFVPDVKAGRSGSVIEQGMNGIFRYRAQEKAAIPQHPAKRTTELHKTVFASKQHLLLTFCRANTTAAMVKAAVVLAEQLLSQTGFTSEVQFGQRLALRGMAE
jgi:hypothetical protein